MTETKIDALVTFRTARLNDAEIVTRLVNSAYRGESSKAGWTTEADLIVGDRILIEDIRELLADPLSVILLCEQGGEIVGSVHLQKTDETAYLGMFVVNPTSQGQGLGKQFMLRAEQFVQEVWSAKKIWMTVITLRGELIAYYERRGYQRTGQLKPFPKNAGASTPLIAGLQMEVLEKDLT